MFESFTDGARAAVVDAQEQARRLHHPEILAEDLLLAVVVADGHSARVLRDHGVEAERLAGELAALGAGDADALREIGIDLTAVRERAEAAFGPGALDRPRLRRVGLLRRLSWTGGHLPFTAAAKRSLEQALRQAVALRSRSITTEHLLLGLLADDADPAARVLQRLGVSSADVRAQVRDHLRHAA